MTQAPKEAMTPVKAPSTKASPVPKPPGNPLTTDDAVGKDAFGLTGGNGGGDTIGGGGGGGDPFGYFDGLLESQIQAVLSRDPRTRFGHYSIPVQLWLDSSGQIIRAQLVQSTGNEDLDKAVASDIRSVLAGAPMPQGMGQPINVRINSQ
jgi:periplasmic protein TonB